MGSRYVALEFGATQTLLDATPTASCPQRTSAESTGKR
jgi:hypothetical protein